MTGAPSMLLIEAEIKAVRINGSKERRIWRVKSFQAHPGTIVYNTDRYPGWSSLENSWHQVEILGEDLREISQKHPEGVHLLGYSQGGLLARAILENSPDHNVKKFISLSSPQAGQFGSEYPYNFGHDPDLTSSRFSSWVPTFDLPNLGSKDCVHTVLLVRRSTHLSGRLLERSPPAETVLWIQFLSAVLQQRNPLGQFDEVSRELAQSRANDFDWRSGRRCDNAMAIKVFFMRCLARVIANKISFPSSHFGYFNDQDIVVPFHQRKIYEDDAIGLKTLEKEGKLKILTFPNVHHFAWHMNSTVIREAIIPYLDWNDDDWGCRDNGLVEQTIALTLSDAFR